MIPAFEFEGLHSWEGYLRSPLLGIWSTKRIASKRQQRPELATREQAWMLVAFDHAHRPALDDATTTKSQRRMWNAMEKVQHGWELDKGEEETAGPGVRDRK